MKKLLTAVMAGCLLGGATSLISVNPAFAQSGTGDLRGVIRDTTTGEPAAGATVVATSPALQGDQVVITEADGTYYITALPPGIYTLTVIYNEGQATRDNVLIQLGKEAVVNVSLSGGQGEVVNVKGVAPLVDQGSTKTGQTITREYTANVPTGLTFGAVMGSAAGAQGDQYGVSISGATSAENVYLIEGLNTTDTAFGTQSSNLPNMFVGETEVITGGYNAEYGRATGGIVNVTTKQGSDEFHGTVEAQFQPAALTASAERVLREGASIDRETNRDYLMNFGAELGGPIIKKKLWFHVGINPQFTKSTTTRIITRNVDADMDGAPDIDAANGFATREEVARRDLTGTSRTAFFTAKINGAVSQNHQFQISGWGNPSVFNGPLSVVRDPAESKLVEDSGAYDVAAKWTSKFANGKTQVDFIAGYHNGFQKDSPPDGLDIPGVRYEYERSLFDFADREGASTIAGCDDNAADDPYPDIINCPVSNYTTGGPGFIEDRQSNRYSAALALTQRVKLAGTHVFKGGLDIEMSVYNSARRYSGNLFLIRHEEGDWLGRQYIQLDPATGMAVVQNGLNADTKNRSIGGYIQDSWQVMPNLTFNLGVRIEQQIGYVAEFLQGKTATDTGEVIPEEAFRLSPLVAPRLGFIYDPSNEGKSKIFGHWGRFYEQVPLDINVRAFGGETTLESTYNVDSDGAVDDSCVFDHGDANLASSVVGCTAGTSEQLGGSISYFAPGTKGQYSEEWIGGAEFQILDSVKVGATYTRRSLPVIIEDMSTDGAANYFIGNPGENYDDEAAKLQAQADAELMADPDDADGLGALYEARAGWLRANKTFDKPYRNYDSVVINANSKPSANSLLMASYTWSRARGNYPGLFSTETGQLDPNLTSMYDLPDLMANRYGATGLDRPHLFKVDGFYTFYGKIITGASIRAQSGLPNNTLAAHPLYGQGESFVLPRGAFRRSPMNYGADVHLAYKHALNKTMAVEAFIDIFNLFNSQRESDVDEIYSFEAANPIADGNQADLMHAKHALRARRNTGEILTVNKNYGNLNARQSPMSGRLGIRFTF